MSTELDFERMAQIDAAELLGVDVRTLRRWEAEHRSRFGFPRNKDGSYHAQALIQWCCARKIDLRR